jgi:hypothetical protein
MPENLLDNLTLQEISDLFAYMGMTGAESIARRPSETEVR